MMNTGRALRRICRPFILLPMVIGATAISSQPAIHAQSASAQVELRIAVSSIVDGPGGVVAVRSTVSHQLNQWTIRHPSQTLFLPRGVIVHLSQTPAAACQCLFQWTLSGNNGEFHRRLVTKRTTAFKIVGTTRVTAEYIKVSGDVSLVPSSPNVFLQPLSASQVRVSPFVALDAAKADWALSDAQIDPRVGIVRALISVKNDSVHQNIKAWIVAANMKTYCPAPGCNTAYSKMVIVVDADSGKAVFSYPTDPSPSVPAMGPPPIATPLPITIPPPPGVYPPGSNSTPTATPPATPTVGTSGTWTGSGPAPTPTPTMQPLQ